MRKPFHRIGGVVVASLLASACQQRDPTLDAEAVARYLARAPTEAGTGSGEAAGSRTPEHATRLAVTVVGARGLSDLDAGPGDSDPYVVLVVEGQRHRTSTAEGTADPDWGDSFIVEARAGAVLEITVFDADGLSSDERLAVTSLPLPPLKVGAQAELKLPLRGGAAGELTIGLRGLAREGARP